jgi:oligopeptide/dipeptide ABC transporter ATP-binding protein
MSEILTVRNLYKSYIANSETFYAIKDISFNLNEGEVLSIVGESGSGKSTLARLITKLENPDSGHIFYEDQSYSRLSERKFRPFRRNIQLVFQDTNTSLDPKMTIEEILIEPLLIHKIMDEKDSKEEAKRLMIEVGLSVADLEKFQDEFSGGQKQRIMIARSLILKPRLLILDEPVSGLDVSVQSQILNLLMGVKRDHNLTYVFIAHGLNVVRHVSDRVMVMYLGKIMEIGTNDEIFMNPRHPYTKKLIESFFDVHKSTSLIEPIQGEIPSILRRPKGCVYSTRCPFVMDICLNIEPDLDEDKDKHLVACHLVKLENIKK